MYVYDLIAVIIIGISHVILYLELIRYHRLPYMLVILLSIIFTVLLGMVITVTGYPEFNIALLLLFLLSLGLMQAKLNFMRNLYFTLASIVSITLVKIVLMEVAMMLLMWSPFNLYIWTTSLIHFIVSLVILGSVLLLRKYIQQFAMFIVDSPLYMISYVLFILGIMLVLILTAPTMKILANINQTYGEISYISAFILFFILLLMVLVGAHLAKERLVKEQEERLDEELLDYVKKLEVLHGELASFRHDYTNVLLTLDGAVRNQDIKQVEEIYFEVIAPTSELINHHEYDIIKLSKINIPEIKSILSVKIIIAQQHNLQVLVDIPQQIDKVVIGSVPFIRIVSNLVDNAIEAAIYSEEKMLQIAFFETSENQYFVVRNSVKGQTMDLQEIYEKGNSSKAGNRGYGLYAVKRMVDKTRNITLETAFNAPIFSQTLIMRKR